MGWLIFACIIAALSWIMFGIGLILTILDYCGHGIEFLFGEMVVLFLVLTVAVGGTQGIYAESYKLGAKAHYLGQVKVEMREAAPIKEDIIYIDKVAP